MLLQMALFQVPLLGIYPDKILMNYFLAVGKLKTLGFWERDFSSSTFFGHLMRRADSFEKTLMLEKIEGRRRRGQQRMRWLAGITMVGVWEGEVKHLPCGLYAPPP